MAPLEAVDSGMAIRVAHETEAGTSGALPLAALRASRRIIECPPDPRTTQEARRYAHAPDGHLPRAIPLKLKRYPTPAAFLAAAEPFLLRAEVENNLILGIAHALATGSSGASPTPYFAAVLDPEIRLCAFSTLPSKLGITQADSPGGLDLLAQDAHLACPGIRDILGPEPTAGAFVERFAALRGRPISRRIAQRIHQLTAVIPPDPLPPGRFRAVRPADLPVVTSWIQAFMAETDAIQGDPAHLAASRVASGELYVWEDRHPVTMAAWTGRTPNSVRINLVYTPPTARERGYATACVAALSQTMLDAGTRFCCLYTDLANPTSNAIYRRIGYRPVSDAALYTLAT